MQFQLTVYIPDEEAETFAEGMTGNDNDIILAAEKAMRAHMDNRTAHDPAWELSGIELSTPAGIRLQLREHTTTQ
jgi:hypothetical protein